jgi:hypothetical protein
MVKRIKSIIEITQKGKAKPGTIIDKKGYNPNQIIQGRKPKEKPKTSQPQDKK